MRNFFLFIILQVNFFSQAQNNTLRIFERLTKINNEVKSGDFEGKNKSLDSIKIFLDKEKNDSLYGLYYRVYSNYYNNTLEVQKSLLSIDQSIHYYSKAKHYKGVLLSTMNKGNRCLYKGENEKAINAYIKALAIAEKYSYKQEQALLNKNVGVVFFNIGKFQEALKFAQRSLRISESLKISYDISAAQVNIGNCYYSLKEYKKALEFYNKAEKIALIDQDSTLLGKIYNNQGSVYIESDNDTIRGLNLLLKSLKYKTLSNSEINDLIFQYVEIGQIYTNKKQYSTAKNYLGKGFSMAVKNDNKHELQKIYQLYSEIYSNQKDYENAFKYHKLYSELNQILYNQESSKAVEEIKTKYQTVEKEKQILKKDIALKKSRYLMLSLVGLGCLIALMGYLFYHQQKVKNVQQKQEFELKSALGKIEAQNQLHEQRLSISRDLHDNIGSQLTFIISSLDTMKFGLQNKSYNLENKLTQVSDFTKNIIIELRDTIWAMNTNEIVFEDLKTRILNFIDQAKNAKESVDFQFLVDDKLKNVKLSSFEWVNIYRTIQEVVNNAIKHADASTIAIDILGNENRFDIEIKDDGKGFNRDTIAHENGLLNIEKRIENIGGKINIDSLQGKGTTVRIEIVLK